MTVLFVGHIGVMELGASALATMWVNITGLSIVYGGASALDSLAAAMVASASTVDDGERFAALLTEVLEALGGSLGD